MSKYDKLYAAMNFMIDSGLKIASVHPNANDEAILGLVVGLDEQAVRNTMRELRANKGVHCILVAGMLDKPVA